MGRHNKVEEGALAPFAAVSALGKGAALVLAPHPDDEVFGCAGAIASHAAAGDPVTIVVVTDGGAGAEAREAYVATREAESVKAATVLGCSRPQFWGLPDRSLEYQEALVARLEALIRQTGASFVYCTSPTDLHPDHRALGLCALEAVRRVGSGANAQAVSAVLYEVGAPLARPNRLLDLRGHEAKKREAIACFDSQLERQRYAEQIEALNRFRTYTLPSTVTAAEAYRLIAAHDLAAELRMLLAGDARLDGTPTPNELELPLISVIVRTLGRDTLPEALASIAAQTYPRVEVVVVNAGTAPLAIEAWCGRFPVRMVGGETRRGRAAAANLGLEAAQGALACFLDDDDWFYPRHLERLHGLLSSQRAARVAYAGVECVRTHPDGGRTRSNTFNSPWSPARLLTENYLPIHGALFARSLFTDEGCRFDESLELLEDWDFWLQCSRKTHFLHLDEIGAAYRLPGGSALSGPDRVPEAAAAGSLLLGRWSPRWTKAELEVIWSSAREHLSPSSESAQRAAADVAERERLKARVVMAEAARDQAFRTREDYAAQLGHLQAETLERSKAIGQLERQLIDARGTRDELVMALNEARRGREAAEHLVALGRAEIARRTEELAQERRLREAQAVTLGEAQAELARLQSSVALRSARLVGSFSPRLQRTLGQVMRSVLPSRPEAEEPVRPAEPLAPASAPASVVEPSAPARPTVQWGDLRRTTPISPSWGFERGTPIDRYYGDAFMKQRAHLVTGTVLEIQRPEYATRYGHDLVRVDTVDFVDTWKPTFLADLSLPANPLPEGTYDCVLVPYTLHVIPGVENAMRHLFRALKPNGVILCTMSTFVPGEPPGDHDYWHLYAAGWQELARRCWPGHHAETFGSYGNSLSAVAAMMGIAAEELTPAELDVVDPRFPVLTSIEARAPRG